MGSFSVMPKKNTQHLRQCLQIKGDVHIRGAKHASWLNMAELEIGIMEKQCTGCRVGTETRLTSEVSAWQLRRNVEKCGIEWTFRRENKRLTCG